MTRAGNDLNGARERLRTVRSTCLEAKTAQTVTSDLLSGARRVRDVLSGRSPFSAMIVYGGSERQQRSDVTLVPRNGLHEQPWG